MRSTTIHISGLHHAACTLAPSGSGLPLPGLPSDIATALLARHWAGGTVAFSTRTHWVTSTNFVGLLLFPTFRACLGAIIFLLEGNPENIRLPEK